MISRPEIKPHKMLGSEGDLTAMRKNCVNKYTKTVVETVSNFF
jgi:hypothetical protein